MAPVRVAVADRMCLAAERYLSKVQAGQPLDEEEKPLYDSHPHIAGQMLQAIPRLEDVAPIVAGQNESLGSLHLSEDRMQWSVCAAGRILLRAATDFDSQILKGIEPMAVLAGMRAAGTQLPAAVIEAMQGLPVAGRSHVMRQLRLLDLSAGMLLDEALVTKNGACLVPAGQEVTSNLLLRLRSIAANVQLQEPIRVKVPV